MLHEYIWRESEPEYAFTDFSKPHRHNLDLFFLIFFINNTIYSTKITYRNMSVATYDVLDYKLNFELLEEKNTIFVIHRPAESLFYFTELENVEWPHYSKLFQYYIRSWKLQ